MGEEIPFESRIKREMIATTKEMSEANVPLHLRDYCAHLYIPLIKCIKEHYYFPTSCPHEKHLYELCKYNELLIRKERYREKKYLEKMEKEKKLMKEEEKG
jgi:NADH dehydrogenase (ubiquinone) 1 beta subcomplex subunit 7